jgi:iron complex outermembrane receptor protein
MKPTLNPLLLHRLHLICGLVLCAAWTPVWSAEAPILTNLTFEELAQINIITASRTPEPLWQTAAAVSVLTHDDIEASGATSLPEALRWVPGLNVAQITANSWAVGARGFQWQYANKLLVMIDGRSVYSPVTGGVRWEDNSTLLDDIDRIEVVLGPGASTWGANAVNGVINVVTRSAFDTVGTRAFAGTGNELRTYAGVRQGVKLSDAAALRIYAMYRQADASVLPDGQSAEDSAHLGQGGFRLDWKPSATDALTVQGDFFAQSTEYVRTLAMLNAPPAYSILSRTPITSHGANALVRWRHEWSEKTYLEWQNYWDGRYRDRPQNTETLRTLDSDLVFGTAPDERQKITAGLGWRFLDGTLGTKLFNYVPATLQTRLASAFIQDQIALSPDRWALTLGAKLEHHDFTGWAPQPTARLAYTPTPDLMFWGSIARAIRVPTWEEEIAAFDVVVYPPGAFDATLPAAVRVFGNPNLKAEKLTAFELGARWKLAERVSFDLSSFAYNYLDYVMVTNTGASVQTAPPALVLTSPFINGITGESYGGELAVRWEARDWWRWNASYSYVQIQLHTTQPDPFQFEQDETTTPHHTFRLQSDMHFGPAWELEMAGRYVGPVPYYSIPSYTEMDARLTWKPKVNWQVSLVGRNLLHDHHAEYDSAVYRRLTELQRSLFCEIVWKFQ